MPVADGKIKNFNAFIDGVGFAGNVVSGQLPNPTLTNEEFRAGGMDAPVDIETGMEKLTASLVLSKINAEAKRRFGTRDASGLPIVLRGATEDLDGTVKAAVVTLRGKLSGIEQGEWKPGEPANDTYNFSVTYYKLEIGGELFHEIDVPNMIRNIGGTDQLQAQRTALGI